VRSDAKLIQDVVGHAKSYCEAANRGYLAQLRKKAADEERAQRAALEKQVAEAELRRRILSNVKL
jgi:hypothetical protein